MNNVDTNTISSGLCQQKAGDSNQSGYNKEFCPRSNPSPLYHLPISIVSQIFHFHDIYEFIQLWLTNHEFQRLTRHHLQSTTKLNIDILPWNDSEMWKKMMQLLTLPKNLQVFTLGQDYDPLPMTLEQKKKLKIEIRKVLVDIIARNCKTLTHLLPFDLAYNTTMNCETLPIFNVLVQCPKLKRFDFGMKNLIGVAAKTILSSFSQNTPCLESVAISVDYNDNIRQEMLGLESKFVIDTLTTSGNDIK